MRYAILLTFFFVLSSAAILAQDYTDENIEQIYTGWMYEGGNFTVDDVTFWVNAAGHDAQRVSFNYQGKDVIVLNDTCEESGIYFFCYSGAKFLEYIPEIDKAKDQYQITVKKKKAVLVVEKREISEPNPYPWEEVTITTRFTNSGLTDMQEVNFTEKFPYDVLLTEGTVCKAFNNTITWTGALPQGKSILCAYKIKILGNGTYDLSGSFSASSGGAISTYTTETIKVEVTEPDIRVQANLSGPPDPVIGDKLTAFYNISNIGESDWIMLTKFEVRPFADQNIISTSRNLEKAGKYYEYSGRINKETPVSINITFQVKTVGVQYIATTSSYTIAGKRIEIENDLMINVTVGNITTQIKGWNLTAGVNNTITILARNTGERDQFKDILMTVKSDLEGLNTVAEIDEILRRNHREAAVLTFVPPDVSEPTEYPVTIDFDYHTVFDQPLHSEYNLTVMVYPSVYVEPVQNDTVEDSGLTPGRQETFGEVVQGNAPVFVGISIIIVMSFLLIALLILWKKRKARAYTFEDLLKDESAYEAEEPTSKREKILKKIEENKNKET